jgi:hypothetical protein
MKSLRGNVLLMVRRPPPKLKRFVETPKGNDRMVAIELRNCDRVRRGTATIWRWRWRTEAIKLSGCRPFLVSFRRLCFIGSSRLRASEDFRALADRRIPAGFAVNDALAGNAALLRPGRREHGRT